MIFGPRDLRGHVAGARRALRAFRPAGEVGGRLAEGARRCVVLLIAGFALPTLAAEDLPADLALQLQAARTSGDIARLVHRSPVHSVRLMADAAALGIAAPARVAGLLTGPTTNCGALARIVRAAVGAAPTEAEVVVATVVGRLGRARPPCAVARTIAAAIAALQAARLPARQVRAELAQISALLAILTPGEARMAARQIARALARAVVAGRRPPPALLTGGPQLPGGRTLPAGLPAQPGETDNNPSPN